MTSFNDVEKRKFLRIDAKHFVEVSVLKNNKIESLTDCQSKNISRSGILFNSKSQFPVTTLVAIKLDFSLLPDLFEIESNLIFTSSYVLGRVVRIEEDETDKNFNLGISFLCHKTVLEEDEQELLCLIKEEEGL